MYDFLLENSIDLLEFVEMNKSQNKYTITEASISGMKITKENLEDEEFVKELVKKIREDKHSSRTNVSMLLFVVGMISTLTIVAAPIGILLLVIASSIKTAHDIREKDLKKLDDCFEKTINKLNNKLKKTKEESKKDELLKVIKDLENNRERIYERKANAEIQERLKKIVDLSKYGDRGIKVGSTEIICRLPQDWADIDITRDPVSYAKKYNSEEDLKSNFTKSSKLPFDNLEQFYASGIKTHADFMKLIKSKGESFNGIDLIGGDSYDSYGPTVTKILKNKQVVVILSDVHDTTILYSYDDDCCYDWLIEETDDITKISVNDFLKASKTAYEDLVKIYKEFK